MEGSRNELLQNDPEYFCCKITFCWQKNKTPKSETYMEGTKDKSGSLVNHVHLYIGDLTILGKHSITTLFFLSSSQPLPLSWERDLINPITKHLQV